MKKVKFEDVEDLVNLCIGLVFQVCPPNGTGGRTTTIEMVSIYVKDMYQIINFLGSNNIIIIYDNLTYRKLWTKKLLNNVEVNSKLDWLGESVGIFDWDEWYQEILNELRLFVNKDNIGFLLNNFISKAKMIGIDLEE